MEDGRPRPSQLILFQTRASSLALRAPREHPPQTFPPDPSIPNSRLQTRLPAAADLALPASAPTPANAPGWSRQITPPSDLQSTPHHRLPASASTPFAPGEATFLPHRPCQTPICC